MNLPKQQQTQRQKQQRQILSQMGVDWWISTESHTLSFADIDNPVEAQPVEHSNFDSFKSFESKSAESKSAESKSTESKLPESKLPESKLPESKSEKVIDALTHSSSHISSNHINSQLNDQDLHPSSTQADNLSANQSTSQLINPVLTERSSLPEMKTPGDGQQTIRPFQLQAVHYANWVLLVDSGFLQEDRGFDGGLAELWQNIYQALDKPVETLKFPLVIDTQMVAMSTEPMDTVELANATLAGFIFKMVKTEQVKLSSLTELSEGLDDERLVRLPLLNEMMAEPLLKKKFWQLLHG